MWSAMAFINSGGTLFPTRAPSAVANFPERRFGPTGSFARTRGHRKCCRFSYSHERKGRLSKPLRD